MTTSIFLRPKKFPLHILYMHKTYLCSKLFARLVAIFTFNMSRDKDLDVLEGHLKEDLDQFYTTHFDRIKEQVIVVWNCTTSFVLVPNFHEAKVS